MKYIICTILFLNSWYAFSQSNPAGNSSIRDGLYRIIALDSVDVNLDTIRNTGHLRISFSPLFEEYNKEGIRSVVIDTSEYVPLELEKAPVAEQQTDDKKKLLLYLSGASSEKLKSFSAKHVMEKVVIVVDSKALTIHKIREPITSGSLQITRCSDNACERLFVKLKTNIK